MAVRLTLDEFLKERNISRYKIAKDTDIKYQIVDNYYKNKVTRYDSYILDKFCKYFNCDIRDLIRYIPE